jgi:hypothetical protein
MELDSVREVKAQLVERVAAPLSESPKRVAAFGVAATSVSNVQRHQPTVALGVAPRGRRGYGLAVRIQHRAVGRAYEEEIRQAAKGEADIRYVGRIVKRQLSGATSQQRRHRPLVIGISVGHFQVTAGTIGCFVQLAGRRRIAILSNNHVLADENAGRRGDDVLQPGRFDRGRAPRDVVAQLERFVRLKPTGVNHVDCAVATVVDGIEVDHSHLAGGHTVAGVASDPEAVDRVEKIGRTTGHTTGRITAFEVDNVVVGYDFGTARFDGQIEIDGETQSFSQGGDSGSLIYSSGAREAVGLLFAGSGSGGSNDTGLTYANPFEAVLTQLRAELLT